ncbi:uncharacterized protein LOC129717900 isoform X2 [Wyeomyia smithii]|uniref:uncharacterized protein LOC129717900 isoform X2 n=1 Tax=Wyeomyia smithii TaxID=174621 RepID=UPI002467C945|nr:uncharacterized protein LOC129717900 isoform X2 [Wyeomyia smithii]
MGQATADQIVVVHSSSSSSPTVGNFSDWQQLPEAPQDGPKRNLCSIGGWYKNATRRASVKGSSRNKSNTDSSSGSSSFLSGTVAATDQVLLKLVQRLASLRSGGSNSKKCKSKKHKQVDRNNTPDVQRGEANRPVAPIPVEPILQPTSGSEIDEPSAVDGGNYHAQIAVLVNDDDDDEGENDAFPSGGPANQKCISFSQQPNLSSTDDDDDHVDSQPDARNLISSTGNAGCHNDNHQNRSSSKMGSNVSRHHEKGLTGRRAQSTDNLKSDHSQSYQPYQYIINNNNNNVIHNHTSDGIKSNVPPDLTPGDDFRGPADNDNDGGRGCHREDCRDGPAAINPQDRNKFCGSLPNHLDADDACEAIFKQNEFLQTHLKNVLATHQQQQPEYVTASSLAAAIGGHGNATGSQQHQQQQQPPQQQQQLPPTYQQSSPFCSSSSGKGSTVSSTTFRTGNGGETDGDRPELGTTQLTLPLLRSEANLPSNATGSNSSGSTTADTGCDQGYGSERSPEDELPPPLLLMHEAQYNEILASSQQPPVSAIEPNDLQRYWNYEKAATSLIASGEYSFITKDTVFLVQVPKGTRGLGLSVSGGSDSSAPFPGLIRIKRLFPHQAAWATGMLQPGDILLESNGIPLTGLTNYEALEVLRTAPNYVTLTVCRPQDEQYRKLSPPSEPPKPPLRNALSSSSFSEMPSQLQSPQLMQFPTQQQMMIPHYYHHQQQQQQQQLYGYPPQSVGFAGQQQHHHPVHNGSFTGEFEIILTKQQGSLGFTLRKEDESVLGHCVRALVRDPALNDGRIKPGDKIVAVNDVPISQMTHEEAVIFLRQAADVVKLRLYRDQAQTPLSGQSPLTVGGGMEECPAGICSSASTSTVGHGSGRPKPNLRPEALNLLTDIAHRKQSANSNNSGGGSTSSSSVKSSNASPRRLRRGLPPTPQSKKSYDNHGFQHSGGDSMSNYSDSETSTIVSQGSSYLQHHHHPHHHHQQPQMVPAAGVFHSASCRSCSGTAAFPPVQTPNLDELYYCDDEIDAESLYEGENGDEQQRRPNFLDLAGESGSTPTSSRKPRFQFSVANTNAYELNNLDNEALDAPAVYALNGTEQGAPPAGGNGDQFMSLPCETFLVACKTENDLNADSTDAIYVKHFAHKSPLYSSFNVPLKDNAGGSVSVSEVVDAVEKGGKQSLMKWKGASLTSDDETPSCGDGGLSDLTTPSSGGTTTGTLGSVSSDSVGTQPEVDSSVAATIGTASTTTPTTERELNGESESNVIDGDGNKIFTVELNKRWNSRLGFSLKRDPESGRTVISAIYSDSVAAKDGRLRVGDQVIMVNDESVEEMSTAQVIDLLRIIRGSICLRLIRRAPAVSQPISVIAEENEERTVDSPAVESAEQIEEEMVNN